tara:strand:- start:211 stop:789 length:579 start_codon:yes stop_codon:yes gene_type:complete
MEVIIILSHFMNKNGILDNETIRRIGKAIKICSQRKINLIITSGWAYRKDNSNTIGRIVKNYILDNFKLENCKILVNTKSRDTVGDAFFSRAKLIEYSISKITVVTSDYHIRRAKLIFNSFFSNIEYLEILGIKTSKGGKLNIKKKERSSIDAFLKTFGNVDFDDDDMVLKTLKNFHPYYNGDKHPKINYLK